MGSSMHNTMLSCWSKILLYFKTFIRLDCPKLRTFKSLRRDFRRRSCEYFDQGLNMAWVAVLMMPCSAAGQNFYIFQLFYKAALFEATDLKSLKGDFRRRSCEYFDQGLNMAWVAVLMMPCSAAGQNFYIFQLFYKVALFEATDLKSLKGYFRRRSCEYFDQMLS